MLSVKILPIEDQMGAYIHSCVELKTADGWVMNHLSVFPDYANIATNTAFRWQSYGLFGFLGDVRNSSKVSPLSANRGLPEDASDDAVQHLAPYGWFVDATGPAQMGDPPQLTTVADKVRMWSDQRYGYSYVTAAELFSFDYDRVFLDQRETPPHETSYREFLGALFFRHLDVLKALGRPDDVRVLFCFD